MAKTLGVVVIHGMGSQGVGFARKMKDQINRHIEAKHQRDSKKIQWQSIYWANQVEQRELDYMSAATAENDLDWIRVRKFVVTSFGDAVAYRQRAKRKGSVYRGIHKTVAEGIADLRTKLGASSDSAKVPLIVLAHSLGGVIMSDYIWDMKVRRDAGKVKGLDEFEQLGTLVGIVTFGCNLPLFSFGSLVPEPIDFPGFALTPDLEAKAKWLNYYDPDDVLGYPLKQISDLYRNVVTADIPIGVGGPILGWNPAAHCKYWTDNDFTKPVAEFISEFL
ncbi:hypothetical protein KAW64_03590 [bacterium]|nr:hypothetical protein [bacterium]